MYDITWRRRYKHLSSWLTDASNLTNPNSVIILPENKADLEAQKDAAHEEAKQFAEENGLLFLEASEKMGENIEDAFLEAAKRTYHNNQGGSLDLNAAESGVQHKPSALQRGRLPVNPNSKEKAVAASDLFAVPHLTSICWKQYFLLPCCLLFILLGLIKKENSVVKQFNHTKLLNS